MKSLLLAVILGVSAGCATPYAVVATHKPAWVTQAPTHKPFCPKEREESPIWLSLHPECRRFTACLD